ncbi:DUF4360 domain-containing protein [Plantactinospora sp. WMMB782]|uniref:DUF4360 domain-containing protein n=1 Tax=Plantactinospora sp. WMMB782 TaxID=3404121 RepID=UPI003B9249F5
MAPVAAAHATVGGAAGPIVIESIATSGSGCPGGSASVTTSDGTVRVTFPSSYTARRGSGATPADFRRNCLVIIRASTPAGSGFTVASATYTGTSALSSGAVASSNASYSFAGQTTLTTLQHPAAGTGAWSATDSSADLAPLAATACSASGIVNVNTDLRVTGGTGSLSAASAVIQLATVPC